MNLLEEAIIYATVMHQGKVRKFSGSPYILHPVEVAQILSTITDDEEVITAGILHDIVEDTDGTLEEIKKRFGTRVAALVNSESENKYPGEERGATWKRRKEESLQVLKNSTDISVEENDGFPAVSDRMTGYIKTGLAYEDEALTEKLDSLAF